jgi:hypothetical protein
LSPELLDRIGLIAGAVFTVAIFSYLLSDNFLYRIAINIFIGAAAAFILIASVESVLIPWVQSTILAEPFELQRVIIGVLPFLFGVLLLFKFSARLAWLGNLGMVLVIGVGTAVALWGAVIGTLAPLALDVARGFKPDTVLDGLIILIGTVCVLIYFTYLGVRRPTGEVEQLLPIRFTGAIGQAFIAVTLGATYALLIISALTVLINVIVQRLFPLRPGG